jgi:hypothetical protein
VVVVEMAAVVALGVDLAAVVAVVEKIEEGVIYAAVLAHIIVGPEDAAEGVALDGVGDEVVQVARIAGTAKDGVVLAEAPASASQPHFVD